MATKALIFFRAFFISVFRTELSLEYSQYAGQTADELAAIQRSVDAAYLAQHGESLR